VAAGAAFFTAVLMRQEAKARSLPHVAYAMPRFDADERCFWVPMKNLGLGPAISIAFQIMKDNETIAVRISMGLAPLEREEWKVLLVNPEREPPTLDEIAFEGSCTDASGIQHPLHFWGEEPTPIQPRQFEDETDEPEDKPDDL